MSREFEIAMTPAEGQTMEGDAYLVVDVLRATTTIATLFGNGLGDLVVTDSIERAREIAARDGRLLFGEVGGLPPEGFDHGNSPVEAVAVPVEGQGAVLFTTNGTPAIAGFAERGVPVATGSLANIGAAARFIAEYERPIVVCAGGSGGYRFALEDFAAAGAIVQVALRLAPGAEPGDAAGMALDWMGWEEWIASGIDRTGRPGHLVGRSKHARQVREIGLGADVEYAARENTSDALPVVVETGEGWARLEAEGG